MRGRRVRPFAVALVALLALGATAACDEQGDSSTDDGGGGGGTSVPTLPFDTPSRDELADATGIVFPESVDGYRSVQVAPGQIDVMFTIAGDDVDELVDGSGLPEPSDAQRALAHSSPLWELNPTDVVVGTTTERDGISIAVEIVGADDPRIVRLSVRAVAEE